MERFLVRVWSRKQVWLCDHAGEYFINLLWRWISRNTIHAKCHTSKNENTTSQSAIARSRDGRNRVFTELYLLSKRESENIDKTPKIKDKIWSSQPLSGFRSLLRKGESISTHTFVVLNESHVVSFNLNVSLC